MNKSDKPDIGASRAARAFALFGVAVALLLTVATAGADEPLPKSYKDLSQPQIDSLVRLMLDDESGASGCPLLLRGSTEYFDAYVVRVRSCTAACATALQRLNERAGDFGIVFERTTSGCSGQADETQERPEAGEGREVKPVPTPTIPPPEPASAVSASAAAVFPVLG
ncbi:MAG: hypothetical protein AAFX58_11475 [Pseudomonadota bacterium]